MNRLIIVLAGIYIIISFSCSKEEDETDFAIYSAKNAWHYYSIIDYNTINLDTVKLSEEPFLTLKQIETYDTVYHIITLYGSKLKLTYPYNKGGQLFVVLVNKKPVYCGFFWDNAWSMPCRWVVIQYPPEMFPELQDNQLMIRTGYPTDQTFMGFDPRNDPRVIDAFVKSGKIAGND